MDHTDAVERRWSSHSARKSLHSSFSSNPRWRHRLPDKPGCLDLLAYPFLNVRAWLRLLCDNYCAKFILMLTFGEHLLKGFVAGGGGGGLLTTERIMYRGHLSFERQQVYFAVTGLAWALKPLFSVIADGFVIMGYRRAPWIVITALMATAAYVALVTLPLPPVLLCVAFLIVKVNVSCTDIILEGQWTEKLSSKPQLAPDLLSWVYMGISLCSILGVVVAGPGIDRYGEQILWVCIPFPVLCAIGAALGFTTEARQTKTCGIMREAISKYRNFFLCAIIASVCVLGTAVLNLVPGLGKNWNFGLSMLLVCVVCIAHVVLLPGEIWKPCLYLFISNALSLDYASLTYSFYLDDPEGLQRAKCPDFCPHFPAWFFVTVINIVDALFAFLGSWLFNKTMSGWTYRKVLVVSQLLVMVASTSDAIQFSRVNRALGIPDEVFLLGKSATASTFYMMSFMPITILISQTCPEGVETLTFALMAGICNFGAAVSGLISSFLMQFLDLVNTEDMETWNFDNAWLLALLGSCLPVITLSMLPWTIPDARMKESLRKAGPAAAESEKSELLRAEPSDKGEVETGGA